MKEISREIGEFKGDGLIIGCGHGKEHNFNFTSKSIGSSKLHSVDDFYHVSLKSDYSEEGELDLEADFLNKKTIDYLGQKKDGFDLIVFEAVTEIISDKDDLETAIAHAKKLLSTNGVLFIYFGGRDLDLLDSVFKKFNYAYKAVYGISTWSLLASDQAFSPQKLMQKYSYLDYMFKEVLSKKEDLEIECQGLCDLGNEEISSSSIKDMNFLKEVNPFAINNGFFALPKYMKQQSSNQNLKEETESYKNSM